ncbi:alpha-E domain-containing protein [Chlorobium phaeovibrioides]|uniref:Alpha-E domain-containing protein n=1 Tax=Chlorobium phaeovibrioides TaxID=1094 RepID=A0A3S0LQE9_CHLPH|nr:alpha-E domain-containing protein [Chlorobium phaeovibrioides]RTY38924.1 alpha-E domain-containing protein [Chlorobium phaeovibrioides]
MLSRVAESLFWMSRYVERAENTARFLDVNFNLLLDLNRITPTENPDCWIALTVATSDPEKFESLYGEYSARSVTDYLVFNRSNSNSIISCIGLARENARSIIESISSEMWEQINNLYHLLQTMRPENVQNDPFSFYREIKNASHLFQGITDNTMARSQGWDFIQVAKYLERADNVTRLIDVKYHMLTPQTSREAIGLISSVDIIQWMAVLKSCSALEAFKKVHLSRIKPENILEFLILDKTFPRSIHFSIGAAKEALWRLSGNSTQKNLSNSDRLIGKMEAELSYTTVEDIMERGLHDYLGDIKQRLQKAGEQLHLVYFAYHTPEIEPQDESKALPFTGVAGGRANWSQAQQQQQQQFSLRKNRARNNA